MRKQCARFHFASFFLLFNLSCKIVKVYLHEYFCYIRTLALILYIYIICENAFFYYEFGTILTIVNINQSQQQPNFFVISFMWRVSILFVEIYTRKGI